jgi:hypothetical protein
MSHLLHMIFNFLLNYVLLFPYQRTGLLTSSINLCVLVARPYILPDFDSLVGGIKHR